jgi:hypothetical protein
MIRDDLLHKSGDFLDELTDLFSIFPVVVDAAARVA